MTCHRFIYFSFFSSLLVDPGSVRDPFFATMHSGMCISFVPKILVVFFPQWASNTPMRRINKIETTAWQSFLSWRWTFVSFWFVFLRGVFTMSAEIGSDKTPRCDIITCGIPDTLQLKYHCMFARKGLTLSSYPAYRFSRKVSNQSTIFKRLWISRRN